MSSKVTKDYVCNGCGVEYMITYDEDNTMEEPVCCPFCGSSNAESEELDLVRNGFGFEE
tara:strand:- start:693 stop:869 length:177 start_codon:yes stop_codon:yes gene_type:complete